MRGLALLVVLVLCGCGAQVRPAATASPFPALSLPELQYRLVDAVGQPFYCDPSLYPLGRARDPGDAARAVADLRARHPDEFDAIVRHEHLDAAALSPADEERILGQAGRLAAVPLSAQGARYAFRYVVAGPPAIEVAGTIDPHGAIEVASRAPSPVTSCPVCLAASTLIATPAGEIPVTDVRAGTPVWTLAQDGRRVAVPVVAVRHTPAPAGHRVVHLALADGRSVDVSPGHPLPDGRAVGVLRPGDPLDGSVVVSAERRPYAGGATWDLLPAATTRVYWAGGVPLASTLAS